MKPQIQMTTRQDVVAEIRQDEWSCVLVQGEKIVYRGTGPGVAPLRKLYESEDGRRQMQGAWLYDKVIGKAAAVFAVLGQVDAVYGEVTSRAAHRYLNERGVHCEYGDLVDFIQNRTKNGLCPVEQSVLQEDDPQKAYDAILHTIQGLMEKANK